MYSSFSPEYLIDQLLTLPCPKVRFFEEAKAFFSLLKTEIKCEMSQLGLRAWMERREHRNVTISALQNA